MEIQKLIPILVPALFIAFAALERVRPARPLPRVPRWRRKGALFFLLSGVWATAVPAACASAFRACRPIDLDGLGVIGGAAVGFVAVELVAYAWHRVRHTRLLWRVHQMHHSAERVDVYGAMYAHPL